MQNSLRYRGLSRFRAKPTPRPGARWISFGVKGVRREKDRRLGSDSIRTEQARDLASCEAIRPLPGQATSIFETELQESASGSLHQFGFTIGEGTEVVRDAIARMSVFWHGSVNTISPAAIGITQWSFLSGQSRQSRLRM